MEEYINEYVEKLSREVPNDSLVYIFDTGYVWGMARERILREWPAFDPVNPTDYFNYYDSILKSKTDRIRNVLYKNNNGNWIKLFPLMYDNPYVDFFQHANYPDSEQLYGISKFYIPEMDYVDAEGNQYRILEKDNTKDYTRKESIYIDELDQNVIKLHQFSIENPNYGFELRHLMMDLRIQFLDESIDKDNLLVNLNGVFVETTKLTAFPDSLFVKNARYVYQAIQGRIKDDAVAKTDTSIKDKNTADVEYDDEDYYKRYSINLRLFQWDGVKIKPWLPVAHINYQLIVEEYKNIRIMESLVFDEELPKDRTLILCDGLIMDPSEYSIDGKTVTLKHIMNDFNRLYSEFKKKNLRGALNNAAYYVNNRYYYAVIFEDTETTKGEMILRKSAPLEIGFLGYNTVLFDEVDASDFLIVDGAFLPFTLQANGLIVFPKFANDNLYFEESSFPFKDRKITKIELVNYGKTVKQ